MSLNADGVFLLGMVISRIANVEEKLRMGDCAGIAEFVNASMPPELQVSATDVYRAVKDRPEYVEPTMNVAILRARIDANPLLYSARISGGIGGHQAILNELVKDPMLVPPPTLADVQAAMALRVVPKPSKTVSGAAALVGAARM